MNNLCIHKIQTEAGFILCLFDIENVKMSNSSAHGTVQVTHLYEMIQWLKFGMLCEIIGQSL